MESSAFVDELVQGIRAGRRLAISRALTLCESTHPSHAAQAAQLLRQLVDAGGACDEEAAVVDRSSLAAGHAHGTAAAGPAPQGPASLRVGVSGPPGVGKSSLIEAWGCFLADHGHRVAVLAVDPSSAESGGAILGDKARMVRLSSHPNAYVRPSPARGTLGGVARATYDAVVVCEAAGYTRILIETVGVGQSETTVADLVDCMLLVMPPIGGDELQMIKRGIMEVADVVAVNKADGPTETAAMQAVGDYSSCLHVMPHRFESWRPQVVPLSAHSGRGIPELTRLLDAFQAATWAAGEFGAARRAQRERVTWLALEELLLERLRADAHAAYLLRRLMPDVCAGRVAPRSAADYALSYFLEHAAG